MLLVALLSLPLAVAPNDSRIEYVGRWDHADRGAPACEWSASEVRVRVTGAEQLVVVFDEAGKNLWQVAVDGRPTQVLTLEPGSHNYTVELPQDRRQGRPIVHTVEFVKRTEAFVGITRFRGLALATGQLVAPLPQRRRFEMVGDSITCGYGNEGANQNEHFKLETENAYLSYANDAAREIGADVTVIAWSGRKMWPDNTVPEIYDRTLPTEANSTCDFAKTPAPSAVVINLATNDFGPGVPDEQKWTGAYEAFIRRVWTHYPKARIYCATGSMMSDSYPPGKHVLTTLIDFLKHMIARMNDRRVRLLEFDTQRAEDGLGADYHPSIKTDAIMGHKLAVALRTDLDWK